jgi:hypothetical protein
MVFHSRFSHSPVSSESPSDRLSSVPIPTSIDAFGEFCEATRAFEVSCVISYDTYELV